MRTDVAFTHVALTPDVPSQVDIVVTNTSDVIDGVTVIVDGLDQDWIQLRRPIVSLFPDSTDVVSFTIHAPPTALAGDYLVTACVVSMIDASRTSVHDFWVSIAPSVRAALQIVPSVITKGSTAHVDVTVINTGNATATFGLAAIDQSREVDCRAVPGDITLRPGVAGTSQLTLRGPRPWFGQTATRSIAVTASSGEFQTPEMPITFRQRPRFPRGLLTFLILALIIAVWAAIFFLVIRQIRAGEDKGKTLATEFSTGEIEVPIAKIAAAVTGRVTSVSEGDGLQRVAVEALRIVPDGELVLSGAAATDEEGVFQFDALLPGSYRFRFSASGFAETSTTTPIALETGKRDDPVHVDATLAGESGTISGSVVVPPAAADGVEFTVVATSLTDGRTYQVTGLRPTGDGSSDASSGGSTAPPGDGSTTPPGGGEESGETIPEVSLTDDPPTADPPAPGSAAGSGTDAPGVVSFALDGLPTPSTYRVRVTADSPEFAPLVFEVRVDGGDATELNPLRPTSEPGRVGGLVLDGDDQPLGGVTVRVSSGDIAVEAVTPTRGGGDEGRFEIVGLPTPGIYTITYTKDGYAGLTESFPLGAGETLDLDAKLIGGLGTVAGNVFGDAGGLGGVEVVVEGDGFVGTATTLTIGGTTGGVGSFLISSIPVPGDYTVTYRLGGYESQTLPVSFASVAGRQQLADVTMSKTSGRITGILTLLGLGANAHVSSVEISLDDGRTTRTTRPATSPLGSYAFDDVPAGTYTITFRLDGVRLGVLMRRVPVAGDVDASTALALPVPGPAAGSIPTPTETTAAPQPVSPDGSTASTVVDPTGELTTSSPPATSTTAPIDDAPPEVDP